jgi:endonuclease/exonuclease/phosphatase (EEP) superfamily protein YafD
MGKIEKADGKYNQPPQRAALIGHFNLNGKTLRISNLHLDWQGGFKQRGAQLKHLRDYLKAKKAAEFEIFCGDFNTVGFYRFSEKRLSKLKKVLGEEYINAFHNERTTSYLQMLDHIFVKNMVVSKAQVLKLKGSDHFPLMAEIKI